MSGDSISKNFLETNAVDSIFVVGLISLPCSVGFDLIEGRIGFGGTASVDCGDATVHAIGALHFADNQAVDTQLGERPETAAVI